MRAGRGEGESGEEGKSGEEGRGKSNKRRENKNAFDPVPYAYEHFVYANLRHRQYCFRDRHSLQSDYVAHRRARAEFSHKIFN